MTRPPAGIFSGSTPLRVTTASGMVSSEALIPSSTCSAFYQAQLIRELAVRHITSWTSVELGAGPAPPTPENIAAVMELYPVGERFFQEFTLRQVLLNAAKNGCMDASRSASAFLDRPA
jgi:hypothetical protein